MEEGTGGLGALELDARGEQMVGGARVLGWIPLVALVTAGLIWDLDIAGIDAMSQCLLRFFTVKRGPSPGAVGLTVLTRLR